jgi:hypothetical protein
MSIPKERDIFAPITGYPNTACFHSYRIGYGKLSLKTRRFLNMNKENNNNSVEQERKKDHNIDIEPQREGAKTKKKEDKNK